MSADSPRCAPGTSRSLGAPETALSRVEVSGVPCARGVARDGKRSDDALRITVPNATRSLNAMRHLRIALYDMTSGTPEEAIEIARKDILPLFEEQPGLVRYEAGSLDNGGIVSFSVWETADEAQHAVDLAATWVRDNLADRIKMRE